MERQATQPAAVPTGRKRRRVCAKKKNGDQEAQDLDTQATQLPTSELRGGPEGIAPSGRTNTTPNRE